MPARFGGFGTTLRTGATQRPFDTILPTHGAGTVHG